MFEKRSFPDPSGDCSNARPGLQGVTPEPGLRPAPILELCMSVEAPKSHSSRTTALMAVGLVVLVVAVYWPALFQEMVNYDEVQWIRAGEPPSWDRFVSIVTYDESVWGKLGYFAPLTAVSVMADRRIGELVGARDMVHKASNLLFHCLNCLLVLWLMRILGFDLWLSFTVTAIFAVHPLQVVSVAWLAERKNLLMSFFFLSGLILYCTYRARGSFCLYLAAPAAYCLALLSKPAAVALGPCMFVTDLLLMDKRFTARSALRVAPFIALGFIWTGVAASTEGPVLGAPPLMDRILFVPYKVGFLLGNYFCPRDLSLFYPPVTVDQAALIWWAPSLVFIAVASLLWIIHRRVRIESIVWGLCFYVLNLAPSLGLVPFAGMNELQVADHYQYLANAGLSLAVCVMIATVFGLLKPRAAWIAKGVFTACLIMGLSLLSMGQLQVWHNAESLWKDVIAKYPLSYTAHYNYAHYLDEQSRYREAVAEYTRALSVEGRSFQAHTNLALILMKFGRLDLAEQHLQRALEINPRFGEPHRNLAKIRFSQGRYQEALSHCRTASELGADCQPDKLREVIERMPPH